MSQDERPDGLDRLAPEESSPIAAGHKSASMTVVISGLATSALALVIAYFLARAEFNLIGWYFWYIFPAGAIGVGLLAGSGYCVSSWLTGTKITGVLLWSVVLLQVLCYVEALYVEYLIIDLDVSFLTHLDLMTRSMVFEEDGKVGDPLGLWGYAFRLLELGGFVLGGILAPLILSAKEYCDDCNVYMRSKHLGILPAGITPRKIKKKDTEGLEQYNQEIESAVAVGIQELDRIIKLAEQSDSATVEEFLASHKPNSKENDRLTSRIHIRLVNCPRCFKGLLKATLNSGQGEEISIQDLSATEVSSEFVRDLLSSV